MPFAVFRKYLISWIGKFNVRNVIKFSGYSVFCLCVVTLISGCSIFAEKPETNIFYPSQPSPPRIQFLTTYSGPNDLITEGSSLSQFILGDKDTEGAIDKPYGVAIHDGVIYLMDIRGPGYAKFDLKNKKFDFIYGAFSGKMKKPINISIDKEGNKYIADIAREQILVFDAKDEYVRSYIDKDEFKPSDAVIADNKLFAACMKHHQIHVFDKDSGKILYSIGSAGSKEGELFYPSNIALGPDNHLYISEAGNFRVQKFSQSGEFISGFGKVGTGFGQFARPKGIAVDRDGRIYVVDAAFENVQILDKDGKVLLFFGEPGSERGNINLPAAIVIDYDNVAYFQKFADPKFTVEYIILIASQFGVNKVNVYGFGKMQGETYSTVTEMKNE